MLSVKEYRKFRTSSGCRWEDVSKRLDHPLETMELPEGERKQMQMEIERAVEKSVGKLLFGLKDTLRHSLWKECLDAVHEAARKDTLKS